MAFARPPNAPTSAIASTFMRHMERAIEERCAEHQCKQLTSIKKAAAPKLRVADEKDWHSSRALVELKRAQTEKMRREVGRATEAANRETEANLSGVGTRTTFELRRSVTERSTALAEASSTKRNAEAAQQAKNKRKLAKLASKAKPRTEVGLPAEVLAARAALEQEKRSKHAAEQSELAAANKAAERRLRDVARKHGAADGALAAHAAAHEEKRQEADRKAAAKRLQEKHAAKAHRKQLEQMATAARPKTLVSLSAEHEQKLAQLTQISEQKAKAEREQLLRHEARLAALTAGSQRRIELPPLEGARPRAGSAERRAATLIQAARRGSVGRSDAADARRALARRGALTVAQAFGSETQLAGPDGAALRPSIGHKTVAAAQTWLAAQSRPGTMAARLAQRRAAITPAEQRVVHQAATAAAAAA